MDPSNRARLSPDHNESLIRRHSSTSERQRRLDQSIHDTMDDIMSQRSNPSNQSTPNSVPVPGTSEHVHLQYNPTRLDCCFYRVRRVEEKEEEVTDEEAGRKSAVRTGRCQNQTNVNEKQWPNTPPFTQEVNDNTIFLVYDW